MSSNYQTSRIENKQISICKAEPNQMVSWNGLKVKVLNPHFSHSDTQIAVGGSLINISQTTKVTPL